MLYGVKRDMLPSGRPDLIHSLNVFSLILARSLSYEARCPWRTGKRMKMSYLQVKCPPVYVQVPCTRMSSAFKAGLSAFSGERVYNDEDEHTTHQEAYERENRASSWWFPIGWSTYYQYSNSNGSARSSNKQGSPKNWPDTFHSTQQDEIQHHDCFARSVLAKEFASLHRV